MRFLLADAKLTRQSPSVAAGLTLAGAVLSQNPWRSVDGYAGRSAVFSCWRWLGGDAGGVDGVDGGGRSSRRAGSCSKIRSDLIHKLTFAGKADYSVSSN
jgi:hypothetical protein